MNGVSFCALEKADVVRHDLVRRIVMAYEGAARREREAYEERMRASQTPTPAASIEDEAEGLRRTLSRERPR